MNYVIKDETRFLQKCYSLYAALLLFPVDVSSYTNFLAFELVSAPFISDHYSYSAVVKDHVFSPAEQANMKKPWNGKYWSDIRDNIDPIQKEIK